MTSTAIKRPVSLVDVSVYLPEKRFAANYYANLAGTHDMSHRLGMEPRLVTNQLTRICLRNLRKALGLPRERHHDTFDECGNLFGVVFQSTSAAHRRDPGFGSSQSGTARKAQEFGKPAFSADKFFARLAAKGIVKRSHA